MDSEGSVKGNEGPMPGMDIAGGLMFADFLVCRVGDELKVCHTSVGAYSDKPTWNNVVMGNSAVVDNYDLRTNSKLIFRKLKLSVVDNRLNFYDR